MRGLNKAMLIGRLGKDPELRYTQGGQAVARFSLATDDSWVDKNGERQSRTEWHNLVAWAKLAETCGQYLRKGKLIYAEGRIQTRQYEDNSGNKRYITEINLNDMQILEPKAPGAYEPAGPAHAEHPESTAVREAPPVMDAPITDDDVPF